MYIKSYKYLTPTKDCGDHIEIEGITREGYTTKDYSALIEAPTLTVPTAVLYAGGFNIYQFERRNVTTTNKRNVGSVKYTD